ncbi:MAG: SUMF1/EgtB/PvdO family nonheme iron enzyme [Bacteroidaceae bacterium]|nr:SUMF1/EgtB/PvdO family nonheme iron enzyme [Bacteroidaceae bacterium]
MKPTLFPRVLLFAAATVFTFTFTACGGSDDDDTPVTPVPEPEPEPELQDETYTVGGVQFKMVAVTGGTFLMGNTSGDSDEKPLHSVTLSDYHIGQTEVTQALWQAVTGSNPAYFVDASKPVERVSWNECQEFITKLNQLTGKTFRLPTEAEWEFAARGGLKSRGYVYSGSNEIDNVAWYKNNSSSQTHKVATKAPNELGLYDMSGNVWEWCADWYGTYSHEAQTDPTGPDTGVRRVLRGGSWGYDDTSVTYRYYSLPTESKNINYGLRLAL